jgi:hypothetical protein
MVLIDVSPEGIHDRVVPLEDGTNHVLDRIRCDAALYYPFLFGSTWRPIPAIAAGIALIWFGLRRR